MFSNVRGQSKWWGGGALALLGTLALGSAQHAHAAPSADDHGMVAAPDESRSPKWREPSVVEGLRDPTDGPGKAAATRGWTGDLMHPSFVDKRRRPPIAARPEPFGHTLRPGERFRFDVTFAGNPAGLAEAEVIGLEPDPRGRPPAGAPLMRLEGHARTSGIVSLLATVTDDLVAHIDARTGASVQSVNTLNYKGWAPRKYKQRVTKQSYEGRGHVRIEDRRDDEVKSKVRRVPVDTFDPLGAMAWVRSLDLEAGERAKAHTIDGTTLLRLDIESRGIAAPKVLPSIAGALDLGPENIVMLEGELTRVDAFGQAVPGKRVFKLRAFISNDERRIPLVLESDLYVGAIRLELTGYDPPPSASERAQQATPGRDTDTASVAATGAHDGM